VFDFPTIDRLNELSIFVSNFIVFDVQISSILSIYTKCVSTRHVTQKRACVPCVYSNWIYACIWYKGGGEEEAPPGVNICSIMYAIDNPFDESLAANKGDDQRERGRETVLFSAARTQHLFTNVEDVSASRSLSNTIFLRDASISWRRHNVTGYHNVTSDI